jgi:hypothetical protein
MGRRKNAPAREQTLMTDAAVAHEDTSAPTPVCEELPHQRPDAQDFVTAEGGSTSQGDVNALVVSAAVTDAGVPFVERRRGQCAFPLWGSDERIGAVCGEPVEERSSSFEFCRTHRALCLVRLR